MFTLYIMTIWHYRFISFSNYPCFASVSFALNNMWLCFGKSIVLMLAKNETTQFKFVTSLQYVLMLVV